MRPALDMSSVSRSSSGLGHRPFTAVTGVRVPYGMPLSCAIYQTQLKIFFAPWRCLRHRAGFARR